MTKSAFIYWSGRLNKSVLAASLRSALLALSAMQIHITNVYICIHNIQMYNSILNHNIVIFLIKILFYDANNWYNNSLNNDTIIVIVWWNQW